jgi:glycosyltransferase involved in cell wall biosynthesis
MPAPEKLAENIWFHLLKVEQWGWLRSAYVGCILAIRSKLRQIRPDVVHGQGTERYCGLAAAFSKRPNVITIHGNMRSVARINEADAFSYQWCAAKLEQLTLPKVGGIICLSDYAQRLVHEKARKIWLIPNAVGQQFFQLPANRANPPEILCVGSICRYKNQNMLIRALDSLATRHRFRLLFFGDGKASDPYVREFLELVNARAWCAHRGFVDSAKVKQILSRATALALPSLEDNCPMVLLEASAAGTPIMASNVGGIPSVVTNGHTGILFDPYDPSSVESAAERYLSHPIYAQTMAENARIIAEKKFHPSVVSARHIEVYQELLRTNEQ